MDACQKPATNPADADESIETIRRQRDEYKKHLDAVNKALGRTGLESEPAAFAVASLIEDNRRTLAAQNYNAGLAYGYQHRVDGLKSAIEAAVDMIVNCAGVPQEPDSLVQMVKVYLQQSLISFDSPNTELDNLLDIKKWATDFVKWVENNRFADPENMLVCAEWQGLLAALAEKSATKSDKQEPL